MSERGIFQPLLACCRGITFFHSFRLLIISKSSIVAGDNDCTSVGKICTRFVHFELSTQTTTSPIHSHSLACVSSWSLTDHGENNIYGENYNTEGTENVV